MSAPAGRGWLTFDRDAVALTRDGLLRADRLLAAFYLLVSLIISGVMNVYNRRIALKER